MLLTCGQVEFDDVGIEFAAFWGTALVVKIDDLGECGDAAIVHVWGGTSGLAEAGSFEFTGASKVCGVASAGVVETFIGEVGTHVAGDALGLTAKQLQAGELDCGEGGSFSGEVTIVGGIAGDDTARGLAMGWRTCASREGARPSQKKSRPQARLMRRGLRRGPF